MFWLRKQNLVQREFSWVQNCNAVNRFIGFFFPDSTTRLPSCTTATGRTDSPIWFQFGTHWVIKICKTFQKIQLISIWPLILEELDFTTKLPCDIINRFNFQQIDPHYPFISNHDRRRMFAKPLETAWLFLTNIKYFFPQTKQKSAVFLCLLTVIVFSTTQMMWTTTLRINLVTRIHLGKTHFVFTQKIFGVSLVNIVLNFDYFIKLLLLY